MYNLSITKVELIILGGEDLDIYKQIWECDTKHSGLRPISPLENRNYSEGYVMVDTQVCSPDHRILREVHIPDKKRKSYELIEKLFDNYTLNQKSKEINTAYEFKEASEFLMMASLSPPVQIARKFLMEKLNKNFDDQQWYHQLHHLWFRQFNWDNGRDLSGFEHVFIGEQQRRKLVGHHFWYKYWLADQDHADHVDMTCEVPSDQNSASPYVITVSYQLKATDHHKKKSVELSKKRCTFLVGISAEGLLALGTIRALGKEYVPEYFYIKEIPYKLELIMSPDGQSIRTFYLSNHSPGHGLNI